MACTASPTAVSPSALATATAATTTTTTEDDDFYDDMDDCQEQIDPRVKVELETLNQSATDINRLEKEIDEARAKYQSTFSECSQQLELLKKKFGGSIKRARPYYDLKEAAREAQSEALRSARKFQSANGVYLAAKETISLAELRLMDDKAASLSAAWQEMLNHALVRVMEAEQEKSLSEKEHLKRAAIFADVENKLHVLEKKHKRSIAKARSYFEAKKELEVKLQQVKQSVEDLQLAMKSAKQRYSGALKRLENISNGIHEKRRQKLLLMFPREPGVGAEENMNVSEMETSLPSLTSTSDADGHTCFDDDYDDDDVYYDESDEDDGYSDINNESVFRAKVLTTSLDDEDTTFMQLKGGIMKKRGRKPLKRTQSLPVYPGHRTNKRNEEQSSCGSELSSMEEVFRKPLVPLSDRSENCPPDGDSLSSEKNIAACGAESPQPSNDAAQSQANSEQSEQTVIPRCEEDPEQSTANNSCNSQRPDTSELSEPSNASINESSLTTDTTQEELSETQNTGITVSDVLIEESAPYARDSEMPDENYNNEEPQSTLLNQNISSTGTSVDNAQEQVELNNNLSTINISESSQSSCSQQEDTSAKSTSDVPRALDSQTDDGSHNYDNNGNDTFTEESYNYDKDDGKGDS